MNLPGNTSTKSLYPDYHDPLLWRERYPAIWKRVPEDFVVDEIWKPNLDSKGEHILLLVNKKGQNTHWVARELARHAGVRDFDVAYMGMKDRQAVTSQYFSIYLGKRSEPDWSKLELPQVSITRLGCIAKKLRRGDHAGNRFLVTLHFAGADQAVRQHDDVTGDINSRLSVLKQQGFPNGFGAQRFGRSDDNVAKAEAWLKTRKRHKNRHMQGVYLSAVRSAFFNAVLKARIKDHSWNRLVTGDKAVPAAQCTLLNEPRHRCLVPAGTMPGDARFNEGQRGGYEKLTGEPYQHLLDGLHAMGVRSQLRPLVARCDDLSWKWEGMSRLTLSITLGTGCYASTLLEQIFTLEPSDEETDSED